MDLGENNYMRVGLVKTSQETHFLLLYIEPKHRQARMLTSPCTRQGVSCAPTEVMEGLALWPNTSTLYKSRDGSPIPLSQLIKVSLSLVLLIHAFLLFLQ